MKKKPELHDTTSDFEKLIIDSENDSYILCLYVSGSTPQSVSAIDNIKRICEENLKGRYSLKVVDRYQNPDLAKSADVIAAPTLIKKLPLPLRRIIGNMSDTERVLVGLGLKKNKQNDFFI